MKLRLISLITIILNMAAMGQHRLREVVVLAARPSSEIGVQKTDFDSLALKENIALSMADVLAYNSSLFVKNHGRATLSTVAFRGTSAGHTQVTWNGMRINNPMVGTTDFSTVPSYFIDKAALLHGSSSINDVGGGLGGEVRLGTMPSSGQGLKVQYVQGIGSFSTFDEFARISWGNKRWQLSTRAVVSTSPNDYKYINHDKKINIYDDDHNIIGQYHPNERNRSGAYRDFHILQEAYYSPRAGDRIGLNAWYFDSNRELPLLTTDYADEADFENRQRERTFRAVINWAHSREQWRTNVRAGYTNTWLAYDYQRETVPELWATLTRSRSNINTAFGAAEGVWSPSDKWHITLNISAYQHYVSSRDKNVILADGLQGIVGYRKARVELSGAASVRWQPVKRAGIAAVLRQEYYGISGEAPFIPALFADAVLWPAINLTAKASASRNYRVPSLNDLYFLPGGNADLRSERGYSADAGLSWASGREGLFSWGGSATWFDSRIDDWIIWLPTTKGFFSPRNMKKVHAYGIEGKANIGWKPAEEWYLDLDGSLSWTPSVNVGTPVSEADMSVGKQLPYVPRLSASARGRLSWRSWAFTYKWCYYSTRYTMSSNDVTLSGRLPRYYMSNVSLEKNFGFRFADFQGKLAVNNLFNEDYLSVLAHPMPGINFEFFLSITPKI